MEPNTRDTAKRRISALIWGTAMILAAGILGLILYPFFTQSGPDLVDQEQKFGNLLPDLKEIHEKQAKAYEAYEYDPEAAAEALLKKEKK